MYFCDMYCYGDSNDSIIGITGIRNCMGIVYAGPGRLYAVHIPFDDAPVWRHAAEAFTRCIKNSGGNGGSKGYLFGFVNGSNNTLTSKDSAKILSADEELLIIKKGLGSPKTVLYRFKAHLGTQSGGDMADSAAIMVQRAHAATDNPSGIQVFYKRNDEINWVAGGEPPIGQFKIRQGTAAAIRPAQIDMSWIRAGKGNSTLKSI
jgi:hypothetical protein